MRALILASVLFAPLPALADRVSDFTLANGLQVVVIEDHRAPAVTQMVWYRTGAADEQAGHSGIAHFFEHLMFKGTDDIAPGQFSALIEAQGGSDNAFTSWDYTAYFQQVAADRLDLVMQMEADRMRDLVLTDAVVATERNVILEERAQRVDSDPQALFDEQMRAAHYLNHPYGRPIIGWRHEIEGLGTKQALDFYRTFYAPNNAILVVAGDVTPDAVRALAEKHYGPLAPTPGLTRAPRPAEPPQLAERRLEMRDARVAEPMILRRYLAPVRGPGDQKQAAALTYLAELLGGNPTTSLFAQSLHFGDAKAVYSFAGYDGSGLDGGSLSLGLVPMPGIAPADAEAAMDAVLAQFLADGPDAEAFNRVKAQFRAAEIYARDSVHGLANRYGEALANGLSVADVQAWPEILQQVTPEDVRAAAALVLDRKQAVTGWLLPEEVAQ